MKGTTQVREVGGKAKTRHRAARVQSEVVQVSSTYGPLPGTVLPPRASRLTAAKKEGARLRRMNCEVELRAKVYKAMGDDGGDASSAVQCSAPSHTDCLQLLFTNTPEHPPTCHSHRPRQPLTVQYTKPVSPYHTKTNRSTELGRPCLRLRRKLVSYAQRPVSTNCQGLSVLVLR